MKRYASNLPKAASLLLLTLALAACATSRTIAPTPAVTTGAAGAASISRPTSTPSASDVTNTSGAVKASVSKINLNTASAADFLTIPGMGNRMVREFMEYRPYASIQQFQREIGKYVDAAQMAEYEKYVFVPVDANQADAATLKQLPGVTDAVAAALIAGRPYASNDDFLARLAAQAPGADLSAARGYLLATQ